MRRLFTTTMVAAACSDDDDSDDGSDGSDDALCVVFGLLPLCLLQGHRHAQLAYSAMMFNCGMSWSLTQCTMFRSARTVTPNLCR